MLPSPLGAGERGGGGEKSEGRKPVPWQPPGPRVQSGPGLSRWKLASPDPPGLRDLWERSQPLRHPPGPRLRDPSRAHQPLDPVFLLEPHPPPQGLSVKACSPPRALTPGPLTRGRNRINVCMDFRSHGVWWCSWCLVRLHAQLPPGSGLPLIGEAEMEPCSSSRKPSPAVPGPVTLLAPLGLCDGGGGDPVL